MLCAAGDNEIRRLLASYTPGSTLNLQNHRYKRVCLQLFGMAGHGKSALINSCLCVAKDRPFYNEANAGPPIIGPITMDRKLFQIKDTVYIADNRGMFKLLEEEVLEMAAQFCQLRTNEKVTWDRRTERIDERFMETYKSITPEILVPIFVYSADCPWTIHRQAEINPFIREAYNATELFPIFVITKGNEKTSKTLELQFREFGVDHVLLIENYTTTNKTRNPEMDTKILNFLKVCLQEADRVMEIKLRKNPQEEFVKQAMRLFKKEIELQDKRIKKLQEELDKKDSTCVIL